MWIAGLKALISSGKGGRSKIDGWSDGGLYLDVSMPHWILLFSFPSFLIILVDYERLTIILLEFIERLLKSWCLRGKLVVVNLY